MKIYDAKQRTVRGIYGIAPTRVSGLKSIQFGASSVVPSDASFKAVILSANRQNQNGGYNHDNRQSQVHDIQ